MADEFQGGPPPVPTPQVKPSPIVALQNAGFSNQEVGDWATQRRQVLSGAGFDNDEIDHYLTGVSVPQQPAGLTSRMQVKAQVGEAINKGLVEGFGSGPLGFSDETLKKPWMTALMGSPEGRTWWQHINHAVIGGAVGAGDLVLRTANAIYFGGIEGGKQELIDYGVAPDNAERLARDLKGMPEAFAGMIGALRAPAPKIAKAVEEMGEAAKAEEAIQPPTITPEMTEKTAPSNQDAVVNNFPLARIERDDQGNVHHVPIGNMPQATDFLDATKAVGGTDAPLSTTQKLLTLYNENGIHPAEVAHDAQTDVTIGQNLVSTGDDLPAVYRPGEGYGGGKPPIPPEPPEALPPPEPQKALPPSGPPSSFDDAQKRILDHISIGEGDPTRKLTLDRLYTNLLDQFFPISKATSKAEEVLGDLPTNENPYELARLFSGHAGKADHMLNHGMFDFNSYENVGPSLKAILDPVKDDLNGLRAFASSVRALELESRGVATGFDMDAARIVGQQGYEKYGPVMAGLVDYQNKLSAYLRDSGVLSKAGYDAMLKTNRLYVPFDRFFGEDGESTFRGPGGSLQARNPIERIEGSERKIVDPIETIVRNTFTLSAMAEKNAIGTALVDMLKREAEARAPSHTASLIPYDRELGAGELRDVDGNLLPNPQGKLSAPTADILPKPEITQVPSVVDQALDQAIAKYFGDRGMEAPEDFVATIRTAMLPPEGDEIRIFRDGKPETYKVDPDLARSMKGLDRQSVGMLERMLRPFASAIRAGAVLTPDFWGRHIWRDFLYAFTTYKNGLFSPIDMAKGIAGLAKKDEDFQNWLKSGGGNISFVSMDRRYLQNSINQLADTGLLERAWNVVGNPEASFGKKAAAIATLPPKLASKYLLDPLRVATAFAENASHLGAFKKATAEAEALDKAAIQSAGFTSRDVAVDAARMGASVRAWNMVSAFANITLQDTDRVLRAFKDNPASTGIKIAAGISLPSAVLWAVNNSTPEMSARYHEIPQWERDLFWILPVGDHLFRLPKPWGMGLVFGSGVERLLDGFVGKNPDAFRELAKSFMQVSIPGFVPNAFIPPLEQFANRSFFTNRTLVPQQTEKQLPEYQYTPYTTETAKALGKIIGAFPGMREASLDQGNPLGGVARALTSPILLENYIRGWTGTLGMYALNAADVSLKKAGIVPDPPMPTATLADIPIIKAFTVRYPSSSAQSIQDFYDEYGRNKTYFDTWMAMAKEGDMYATQKIQQAGGPQMFLRMDGIAKALSEHNQLIRDIYKDPSMKPDEKRQLIDQLYYSMIQIGQAGKATIRQAEQALNTGVH